MSAFGGGKAARSASKLPKGVEVKHEKATKPVVKLEYVTEPSLIQTR